MCTYDTSRKTEMNIVQSRSTINGYSWSSTIGTLQKVLIEAGLCFTQLGIGAQSKFHESRMGGGNFYLKLNDLILEGKKWKLYPSLGWTVLSYASDCVSFSDNSAVPFSSYFIISRLCLRERIATNTTIHTRIIWLMNCIAPQLHIVIVLRWIERSENWISPNRSGQFSQISLFHMLKMTTSEMIATILNLRTI